MDISNYASNRLQIGHLHICENFLDFCFEIVDTFLFKNQVFDISGVDQIALGNTYF